MPDRDKVIRALEICSEVGDNAYCPQRCPYMQPGFICSGSNGLMKDALALLKEQEPVEPGRECSGGGTTWWNVCGACRTAINPNDKYCHECGRAVKWDA